MKNPVITIAKFTFLEAIKNYMFVLVLCGIILVTGISVFAGELTVTETRQVQGALTGFIMRLSAVFVVSLFVVSSIVREMNDKTVDMIISLDLPRYVYFAGKQAGFLLLVAVISLLVSLPLFFYSSPVQTGMWTLSLICELSIMITLCLLFLFTFGNLIIAFTSATGFYILARCITTIQLISQSPILESDSYSQLIIQKLIIFIGYLLPHFDKFTRTEWLVYKNGTIEELAFIVFQTLVYVVLLSAAALFDLYRKNF